MKPPLRHCRACQAAIYWATTKNGKRIPIDVGPTPDGNIILAANPSGGVKAHVLSKGDAPPDPARNRYKSHFATCPKADYFRI